MGWQIDEKLKNFQADLPSSVHISKITDQAKIVNDSVVSFLRELLIAIVAVILVVIILMPFRVRGTEHCRINSWNTAWSRHLWR